MLQSTKQNIIIYCRTSLKLKKLSTNWTINFCPKLLINVLFNKCYRKLVWPIQLLIVFSFLDYCNNYLKKTNCTIREPIKLSCAVKYGHQNHAIVTMLFMNGTTNYWSLFYSKLAKDYNRIYLIRKVTRR